MGLINGALEGEAIGAYLVVYDWHGMAFPAEAQIVPVELPSGVPLFATKLRRVRLPRRGSGCATEGDAALQGRGLASQSVLRGSARKRYLEPDRTVPCRRTESRARPCDAHGDSPASESG